MRDLVIHSQSGLVLDFAEDDFGGDDQAEIINAWLDRGRADPGEFICHYHRNHAQPSLYLQQRGELLVAAHWPRSGLGGTHEIIHGVSDEHKRQVEYMQRAGQAVGFDVQTEVRLPTRVRPDAVIYGPKVQMGVEVQRSALSVAAAKTRTTKARRAGVQPVWFSDSQSNPKWLGAVPGVRMNPDTSWEAVPGHHSVMVVSGVRSIVGRRCRNIPNGQCPRRRYGCNEWHPDHDPRPTLVDDLAELFPVGDLVPIQYRTFSGRELILVVTRNDKARYEAMVGRPADVPLQPRREKPQPAERIECSADAGPTSASQERHLQAPPTYAPTTFIEPEQVEPYRPTPRCVLHGTFLIELVPGKLYCPACHRREMNALGLANYPVGDT